MSQDKFFKELEKRLEILSEEERMILSMNIKIRYMKK